MKRHSRQDRRTWTTGQKTPTLVEHHVSALSKPARLGNPDAETLCQAIKDGYCWWCDSYNWKCLAQHTQAAHGISAADIRTLAVLVKKASICSESHAEFCRQRNLQGLREGTRSLPTHPNGRRGPHHYSAAGWLIREPITARFLEAAAAVRAGAGGIQGLKSRKPHPCPVCDVVLPSATPITCSPACRRVVRQRTARRVVEARRILRNGGQEARIGR